MFCKRERERKKVLCCLHLYELSVLYIPSLIFPYSLHILHPSFSPSLIPQLLLFVTSLTSPSSFQGQYMICFLISLLIYNICLLPGSVLVLSISFVSCVSLGEYVQFTFSLITCWTLDH